MQRNSRHVLSHAGIYLLARGVPGIIAFASIPLFTRLLAPAQYGQYALTLGGANLLNALLFQWLRLSLVRYLPIHADNPAGLKSTLASVAAIGVLALGAVAAILWLLPLPSDWRAVIWPCWILLAIGAYFEMCSDYSRARIQPWRYMALQCCRSAAMVTFGSLLVWLGFGWRGPLLGTIAGMTIATACVWRTDWSDVKFVVDHAILRQLCHYGVPLSITVALAVVIGTCDRFLIAGYLGESAAGLYSVAVDFTAQTLSLLMMVVQLAVFPLAVRAFEQHGREAAQEQMKTNASLLMAIGLPCVVGLMLLSPGISGCFLGESFRGAAASIMPLVALGTFLSGFKAYHFDAAFQFAHRTIYQVWIVLAVAVVNVLLNLIAIPRWGINGSAVASVIAYLISIVLTIHFGRRHFTLPFPIGSAVRVAGAAGVMALLLIPLRGYTSRPMVVGEIAAAAAVYGATLIAADFLGLRSALLQRLALRGRGFPVETRAPAAALAEVN